MTEGMNQEGTRDTRDIERCFLLSIYGVLGQIGESMQNRGFAVVQGALREVYNELVGLIHNSNYLSDTRIKLLEKFNNNIFRIRENIVGGVYVENRDFAEVIDSKNIRGRAGSAKAALRRYIDYWYES